MFMEITVTIIFYLSSFGNIEGLDATQKRRKDFQGYDCLIGKACLVIVALNCHGITIGFDTFEITTQLISVSFFKKPLTSRSCSYSEKCNCVLKKVSRLSSHSFLCISP